MTPDSAISPRNSVGDRSKRFLALSWTDQTLLMRAAWLVGTIRLELYFVPFHSLLRRALRVSKDDLLRTKRVRSVDTLAWAVTVASRFVPKATCLTQALALQSLLSRSGHRSTLKIGVAREGETGFEAHAWVVCDDHIVIGGSEAARFTVLTSWSNAVDDSSG